MKFSTKTLMMLTFLVALCIVLWPPIQIQYHNLRIVLLHLGWHEGSEFYKHVGLREQYEELAQLGALTKIEIRCDANSPVTVEQILNHPNSPIHDQAFHSVSRTKLGNLATVYCLNENAPVWKQHIQSLNSEGSEH